MADEHDHLLDAAAALDARVGRKPARSASIGEENEMPEDFTDVPDERDVAATRDGGAETDGDR